jgi:transcriptional regulator with XRE-family HTH domain
VGSTKLKDHPVVRRLLWITKNRINPETGRAWSQRALSEVAGKRHSWLNSLMCDRPNSIDPDSLTFDAAEKIAKATNTDVYWLLKGAEASQLSDGIESRDAVVAMALAMRDRTDHEIIDAAIAALQADHFARDPGFDYMLERLRNHILHARSVADVLDDPTKEQKLVTQLQSR